MVTSTLFRRVRHALTLGAAGTLAIACVDDAPTSVRASSGRAAYEKSSSDAAAPSAVITALNTQLRATGAGYQIANAEISVAIDSAGWQGATTIFANDRTHLFGSTFVPSDPRRGGRANITYLVDQSDGLAISRNPVNGALFPLPNAVTEPEIDASMHAWETGPACHPPTVTKVADPGVDPDLIDNLVLGGAPGRSFADITHAGWLPSGFFNALATNGASFILGVTFTFVYIDGNGNPTDIDHDGLADVAFREIYYNRSFAWTPDATNNAAVDIQSVSIHESGHAYGLAHFGRVFEDDNGVIHYAPKSIMNAVYVSADRAIRGTDNASFCHIWANAQ
jgi:hypothetical protein